MSKDIFTSECVSFLVKLDKKFSKEIDSLLEIRKEKYKLDFAKETKDIRDGNWKCNPPPKEIEDRTVEITGPPTPAKMIINALNSGANCYMADLEDSLSPTYKNIIDSHKNLIEAAKDHSWEVKSNEKLYKIDKNKRATLWVRPRGLHLKERNFFNIHASLFDFGVNIFHTHLHHKENGTRPYYYIPKLECDIEAALWSKVFSFAEEELGMERGTIKCTVLIETLPAVFVMDEIIYELKDYIVGLNCGRWDYIFSFIKNMPKDNLPDRKQIDMNQRCMESYANLLVDTCYKRGIAAMGGMSAFIPIKGDEEANDNALKKVREDKLLEVSRGFNGTWVAHPGLVDVAREAFNATIDSAFKENYSLKMHKKKEYTKEDLLSIPFGEVTEDGIKENIRTALKYIASWLNGNGCVPINNLMEDTATAEISRAQLWQWVKNDILKEEDFKKYLSSECSSLSKDKYFNAGDLKCAQDTLRYLVTSYSCHDFLTTIAQDTAHWKAKNES